MNKLLLLTSNKQLMKENFFHLVSDHVNINPSETFVPVEVAATDMYPHSENVSYLVLLEKLKLAKRRKPPKLPCPWRQPSDNTLGNTLNLPSGLANE